MPEVDSIQNILKNEYTEAENMLKTMASELQQLQGEYQAKKDQMSDLIKQTKEAELQDKAARIQQFQDNAQKQLQVEAKQQTNLHRYRHP